MSLDQRCGTCAHWTPCKSEYLTPDGYCAAVGVSYYRADKTVVLAGNILPGEVKLVTDETFGCVRWESK